MSRRKDSGYLDEQDLDELLDEIFNAADEEMDKE